MKSGTTWTQVLCALLIHQSPCFRQPLNRLSRWIERHRDPLPEVLAAYDAQPYRRIVKTHTPLDGIPYLSDVSYLFCRRDPREVFFSTRDHISSGSEESSADARRRAGLPGDFELPTDPDVLFQTWLTTGASEGLEDGFPMGSAMSLTQTCWKSWHIPNRLCLPYADLTADLDGGLRPLARFVGTPIDEEIQPSLPKASFEAMRERARKRPQAAARAARRARDPRSVPEPSAPPACVQACALEETGQREIRILPAR